MVNGNVLGAYVRFRVIFFPQGPHTGLLLFDDSSANQSTRVIIAGFYWASAPRHDVRYRNQVLYVRITGSYCHVSHGGRRYPRPHGFTGCWRSTDRKPGYRPTATGV